jgi:hypothetical protein
MFDAVVIAGAEEERAARTLATLVEGVVDGVLQRVVLLSAADTDGLRRLADAAGCRAALGVAQGGFGEALKPHLATPHALALAAGALLPPGWPEALRQELLRRGAPGLDQAIALRPATLAMHLRLAAAMTGRRRTPLAHGALAPRTSLTARGFDGSAVQGRARMAAGLTVER